MYKFAFLLVLPCIFGQEIFNKECSQYPITTQDNFDVQSYLGDWHELMRYETTFQVNGDCVTATYGLNEDGTVQVVNRMKVGGEIVEIEASAVEQDPSLHDGKLLVQYQDKPTQGNYWVLETDYNNYSVVWSCYSFPGKSIQFLWILGRKPVIENEVSRSIEAVLKRNELNAHNLRPTNNDADYCAA